MNPGSVSRLLMQGGLQSCQRCMPCLLSECLCLSLMKHSTPGASDPVHTGCIVVLSGMQECSTRVGSELLI